MLPYFDLSKKKICQFFEFVHDNVIFYSCNLLYIMHILSKIVAEVSGQCVSYRPRKFLWNNVVIRE